MKTKQWSNFWFYTICAGAVLPSMTVLGQDTNQVHLIQDQAVSAYRAIGISIAAAFAVGVSILGAGYAVAKIGSAAIGALVEKPELLARTILFVALAEGLAVLGFAVAMMLLQKI